ncbi:MAG TPA: response regulator [Chitinophagaceae bacterium]|jgi:CheY-like chemotaxis protein|nr:response regulator [Chitinophagaceae bacterium]
MEKRTLLLAEDDADDQQFFLDFLQGHSDLALLPVAENGEVLLEHLNRLTESADLPHYIILDQNMPRMNGLQTLQALKSDSRYAHIPVMIYSTYTNEALEKEGMARGACLVLPKPFTKAGYEQLIQSFIRACS